MLRREMVLSPKVILGKKNNNKSCEYEMQKKLQLSTNRRGHMTRSEQESASRSDAAAEVKAARDPEEKNNMFSLALHAPPVSLGGQTLPPLNRRKIKHRNK